MDPARGRIERKGAVVMKEIISALVENKAGVLSRMAGLFARRGFNIAKPGRRRDGRPTVSRMTIVAGGDERTIEQIEKQLNKQIDVIKVRVLEHDASTRRELILIKINAAQQTRGEIIDIAAIVDAKIVDLSRTTLTIELCDRPERVDLLIDMVTPYGIVEIARTGMIALQKGSEVSAGDNAASDLIAQRRRLYQRSIRPAIRGAAD